MENFELGKTRATKKQIIEGSVSKGIVKLTKGCYAFNYYFLNDEEQKVEYTSGKFNDSSGALRVKRQYKKWLKIVERDFNKNERRKTITKKRKATRSKNREKLFLLLKEPIFQQELQKDWENITYNSNMLIFDRLYKKNLSIFSKSVDAITETDIAEMLNAELKNEVSSGSIKIYKYAFVKVFDVAKRLGYISEEQKNVARSFKIPSKKSNGSKSKRGKINILDTAEEKIVLDELHRLDYIYQCVIRFVLMTGLRSGEVNAIEWKDIDWENGLLYVHQTMTEMAGYSKGIVVKTYTKSKEDEDNPRILPLYSNLKELLIEYKSWQNKEYLKRGIRRKDLKHDFIFCKNDGTSYGLRRFSRIWQIFRDVLIGEEKLTKPTSFHNLRGTYISRCLNNERIPVSTVKELAGHSSTRITLKYYIQVSTLDIQALADNHFN
ncbi:tyrosine-type recombinase/integrase [Enterococcus sp. DIV0187]|uniref:tyrosine-type recombinase/integrase n=1 Tax=Enterococcus sp. DIV0187 TaxID=2774644 RepID=UPI003F685072